MPVLTQKQKLARRLPTATDTELDDLLESSQSIINARRYPFADFPDELENRFLDLQLRISVDLFNKCGAEGETSHSENGISRSYSDAWVSEELLAEIVPKAGVL